MPPSIAERLIDDHRKLWSDDGLPTFDQLWGLARAIEKAARKEAFEEVLRQISAMEPGNVNPLNGLRDWAEAKAKEAQ